MYILKRGVTLFMSPEIEKILEPLCLVYDAFKLPLVITSGLDGPHRENSLHFNFRAIDIRKLFPDVQHSETWNIHGEYILYGIRELYKTRKYPVIVLNESDHLHIEWNGQ